MSDLLLPQELGGMEWSMDTQQCGVKLFTTYVPGFWSVKDAN